MMVRYRSRRPDDPVLRERLRALAHERRRFGYRRLLVLLRREGFVINHKRLFRIYREERLMVRKRGGRKRALGTRAPMIVPLRPDERWSLDFVSDMLSSQHEIGGQNAKSSIWFDLLARRRGMLRCTIRCFGRGGRGKDHSSVPGRR
jgi:transposase InsO family protein